MNQVAEHPPVQQDLLGAMSAEQLLVAERDVVAGAENLLAQQTQEQQMAIQFNSILRGIYLDALNTRGHTARGLTIALAGDFINKMADVQGIPAGQLDFERRHRLSSSEDGGDEDDNGALAA